MITSSKELGKQIATLRKKKGLSQVELAKLCGIPVIAIRRCEQHGAIPLNRYMVLVKLLGAGVELVEEPLNRCQTIDQVIHNRNSDTENNTTQIRKPSLGGAFDQINPPSPLEKIRREKMKQRRADQTAIQNASKQSTQAIKKLRDRLQQKNSLFQKADLGGEEQKQRIIENVIKQINAPRHSKIDLSKIMKSAS